MKVVVLLSGGIDSMACVKFYLAQGYEVEGIFFEYEQPTVNLERAAANKIAEHYGIKLRTVQIPRMQSNASGEIYGRNAVLAMTALSLYGYGTYKIAIGIHSGTQYPDCSGAFVDSVNRLYDIYANGTVVLEAPFVSWVKAQVIAYCKNLSLPLELTYSCEVGTTHPCGKCNSCLDRKVWLNEQYEE